VDLYTLQRAGGKDNTLLHAGDIVTVPEQLDRVIVLGEVAKPLSIPYRPELTLDDAVALAGGETAQADLAHVKLARKGVAKVDTIDLVTARKNGRATETILSPGDVITLPEMRDQVFVLGSVSRPGAVPYRPGITLMEALTGSPDALPSPRGAGGPTVSANLYDAVLTRADGKTTSIDLDRMIRQGDTSLNVVLQPNDSIYVPESKRQVYVFGAVLHPGRYYLRDNDKHSVLDALQTAGGTVDRANLKSAVLIQMHNGKPSTTNVHLDEILRHGDMHWNVELQPGDVVYVPERGEASPILSGLLPAVLYNIIPFLK